MSTRADRPTVDHGPAAVLTLNRPERRNALSRALMAELSDALDGVAAGIAGPGRRAGRQPPAFCAGMDLKEAAGGAGTRTRPAGVRGRHAGDRRPDQPDS